MYRHIVGSDVIAYILGILNDSKDFKFVNITNIMLIPKIQNPTNLVNFRPVSLCTVIYKIVAKVVAN